MHMKGAQNYINLEIHRRLRRHWAHCHSVCCNDKTKWTRNSSRDENTRTWREYRLTTETNPNPNPNPKPSYSKSLLLAWSEHHHHKKEMHCLPVTYGIQYKAVLLTYMVHNTRCHQYLRSSVISDDSEPGRHDLCSATNLNYILPQTRTKFVERAFSVSWAHYLEHSACVRQIVADTKATWSHIFNCAFN